MKKTFLKSLAGIAAVAFAVSCTGNYNEKQLIK